jgi:hypothetical protein
VKGRKSHHFDEVSAMLARILLTIAVGVSLTARVSAEETSQNFNSYILAAVEMIAKDRSGLGYENKSYTRDLSFGDAGTLKASGPPLTMCVAAQMEVLVEALNIYWAKARDNSPFHYLPKASWERLRPVDLRGQIWIVANAPSSGASDAFANFGMGDKVAFGELTPGSYVNLNRTNYTGHGVIFLGYVDSAGNESRTYSSNVAGFKYFSAQGPKGLGNGGGFGYRWAFFSDAGCPQLAGGKKRDCGIIRSADRKLLNTGTLRMPKQWDVSKAMQQLQAALGSKAPDDPMMQEGEFNDTFFNGITTDD